MPCTSQMVIFLSQNRFFSIHIQFQQGFLGLFLVMQVMMKDEHKGRA